MLTENKKRFLIVPTCTDYNRGDQALVMETKRIAEDAGFKGDFFLISSEKESFEQMKKEHIMPIFNILEHPSRFGKKDNLNYTPMLFLKWGIVSVFDFISSIVLLNGFTRKIFEGFLSGKKKETLKKYKDFDAVFVKGGGFIHSYGGISSFYYMYFVLYHIMLAQSFKKKVYVMPNSFGPFKGAGVKFLVKKVLKNCTLVTSRESISTKALYENFKISVNTYPDLGFFLKKRASDNTNYIFNSIDRKKVAITMRPYRFNGASDPLSLYGIYKNALLKLIIWLYDSGYMPVLVEHTISETEHESDLSCIQDVISELPFYKYILISDRNFDCRDLKNIYSQCDYIIGTRFHSVIFAMAEGVPAIAITYGGNKGNGIMMDIGLSEYSIPIEEVSFEKLKTLFESLIKNGNDIKLKLNKYHEDTLIKRKHLIEQLQVNIT